MQMYFTKTFSPEQKGFTLLEILVVISIVAIMTGAVIVGFTGADRNIRIKTEVERIALLIELARAESMQTNEEWGVYFEEQGYGFLIFDAELKSWSSATKKSFRNRSLPDEMTIEVNDQYADDSELDTSDDILNTGIFANSKNDIQEQDDDESRDPDVVIFSDGELTPFSIEIAVSEQFARWKVQSDGLARVKVEQLNNE